MDKDRKIAWTLFQEIKVNVFCHNYYNKFAQTRGFGGELQSFKCKDPLSDTSI